MAAISWSDVTSFFPGDAELATVSAPAQALTLDYVNTDVNVRIFDGEDGPKTKLARIYLAAHFGKMDVIAARANSGAVTGPVTASSAGGLTRSFASVLATGGAGTFGQTGYGQMYESLLETTAARFGFVT